MRCGPGSARACRSAAANSAVVWARRAGTPIPVASAVKSRSGRVSSSRSCAARPIPAPPLPAAPPGAGSRAHPGELHAEDRVTPVAEDDRGDVQLCPGVRPQRGDRVHGTAVRLQRQHRPVRAGDRGPGGQRQPLADSPAGQGEPVVRGSTGGGVRQPQPGRVGLVGHDRALGQQGAEHGRRALRGQVAVWQRRALGRWGSGRAAGADSLASAASAAGTSSPGSASTCTWQSAGTSELGWPG